MNDPYRVCYPKQAKNGKHIHSGLRSLCAFECVYEEVVYLFYQPVSVICTEQTHEPRNLLSIHK